jgi:hypothetical protein
MIAPRHAPLDAHERAAMVAATKPALAELRAGAREDATALVKAERAALVAAQRSSTSGLERMRAGAMSDHDLTVIGVVLLAVIVVLILV